jgi:nucleotide-binding universal stress UspA family protein
MRYRTVLVGTDGSDTSLQAVATAADLAGAMSAQLLVVCAYHPVPAREQARVTPGLDDTRFRVTGSEAAQSALDAGLAAARAAGASSPEGELVADDAVEAMLSRADRRSPALIVVGNRGMNRLSRRLLGSVPSDVAFRASSDVLIVHTTTR